MGFERYSGNYSNYDSSKQQFQNQQQRWNRNKNFDDHFRRPPHIHNNNNLPPTQNYRPIKIQQYNPINSVTSSLDYNNSSIIFRNYLRMLDQRILSDNNKNSNYYKRNVDDRVRSRLSENDQFEKIRYLDSFCIDNIGMNNEDRLSKPPLIGNSHPVNTLAIPLKFGRDGIHPDLSICFNCGGKHNVKDCNFKINYTCVNFNKMMRDEFGGNNKRLFFRERYFGDAEKEINSAIKENQKNYENKDKEKILKNEEEECQIIDFKNDNDEGDDENLEIKEEQENIESFPCKRRKSPKNENRIYFENNDEQNMLKIYTHVNQMPEAKLSKNMEKRQDVVKERYHKRPPSSNHNNSAINNKNRYEQEYKFSNYSSKNSLSSNSYTKYSNRQNPNFSYSQNRQDYFQNNNNTFSNNNTQRHQLINNQRYSRNPYSSHMDPPPGFSRERQNNSNNFYPPRYNQSSNNFIIENSGRYENRSRNKFGLNNNTNRMQRYSRQKNYSQNFEDERNYYRRK